MKIVFIAGPYFGDGKKDNIERNIRNAEKYQIALANAQVGFFCAHNHTEHFQEKATAPEDFYKKMDIRILQEVGDAVLAIPGWESSSGAQAEVAWAKENSRPIFYVDSPENLEEVIKWARS